MTNLPKAENRRQMAALTAVAALFLSPLMTTEAIALPDCTSMTGCGAGQVASNACNPVNEGYGNLIYICLPAIQNVSQCMGLDQATCQANSDLCGWEAANGQCSPQVLTSCMGNGAVNWALCKTSSNQMGVCSGGTCEVPTYTCPPYPPGVYNISSTFNGGLSTTCNPGDTEDTCTNINSGGLVVYCVPDTTGKNCGTSTPGYNPNTKTGALVCVGSQTCVDANGCVYDSKLGNTPPFTCQLNPTCNNQNAQEVCDALVCWINNILNP